MHYNARAIEVRTTATFDDWFEGLRDLRAKARIGGRINRMTLGNFGDCKQFSGLYEARIDYGPGYRIYFIHRGRTVIVLLCGGDKSTQDADIRQAMKLKESAGAT